MYPPSTHDQEEAVAMLLFDEILETHERQRATLLECQRLFAAQVELAAVVREVSAAIRADLAAARDGTLIDGLKKDLAETIQFEGWVVTDKLDAATAKVEQWVSRADGTLATVGRVSEARAAESEDRLAKLVRESESRTLRMCADMISANEVMARNLEAAVLGKPPLPVTPPGASLVRRLRGWILTPFVLVRRWCIDAMPTAILLGSLSGFVYLLLALRNFMR
jgi:hypothetical protein